MKTAICYFSPELSNFVSKVERLTFFVRAQERKNQESWCLSWIATAPDGQVLGCEEEAAAEKVNGGRRLNANYSIRIDCTEAELGMVWAHVRHAKWYRDTEELPGARAVYCQMQGRQQLWGNFHQRKWQNLITSSRKSYKGDSVQ